MNGEIAYWQPRVMRHQGKEKSDEYAIHEVYFDADDLPVTYTEDSLSSRFASIEALKNFLLACLEKDEEEFVMGDLSYTYVKDHIEFWLEYIDEPPIDYK